MKALLIASVLLIISFSSFSKTTGNELFEHYREYQKLFDSRPNYNRISVGDCQGYVRGVVETYIQASLICTNGEVTFMYKNKYYSNCFKQIAKTC